MTSEISLVHQACPRSLARSPSLARSLPRSLARSLARSEKNREIDRKNIDKISPDLIVTHNVNDYHSDHRIVSNYDTSNYDNSVISNSKKIGCS